MKFKNFLIFYILIIFSYQSVAIARITNFIEPVEYFVNHIPELNDVTKKLVIYKKIALLGNSGIGKTQLTRQYAKHKASEYNIIWVFDCNSNLSKQYLRLVKVINTALIEKNEPFLSDDISQAKESLINFLTPRKDWLLIFDNLKIGQNNNIQDILEWEHNGHIIICSQEAKGLNEVVKLSYLSKEDAIKLASNIIGADHVKITEELTNSFKGYPVMIAQAAFFLKNNPYMTVAEYKKFVNSNNTVEKHIKLALSRLNKSTKDMIYKIALINNQSFSKELLQVIVPNIDNLSKELHHLVNLGLINNSKTFSNIISQFEMHDVIKEIILSSLSKIEIKAQISSILKSINQYKGGIINVRQEFYEDPTLLSNFEIIMRNAETYQVDKYDEMELRKNLIMYYTSQSDFEQWRLMGEWLEVQEQKGLINLQKMDNHYKNSYGWFLIYRGLYREFTAGNFTQAEQDFILASKIAESIPVDIKLKFFIYTNLSQIQIYRGDLLNGRQNLEHARKLLDLVPSDKDLDQGLILFMESALALESGEYKKALEKIDQSIEYDKQQSPASDAYSMSSMISKAEILTRMSNFTEAYELANKLYEQSKNFNIVDYEQQARILTSLASSELNMNKLSQASLDIKEAKRCLDRIPSRLQQNLTESIDFDLASILTVQGDILFKKSNLKAALENYQLADKIYNNRYNNKLKLDHISLLYVKIINAASQLKKIDIVMQYKNKHEKIFGLEHFRTKEILKKFLDL